MTLSSRCPRPMGIMASIALMPVCSGSFTLSRCTIPGAFTSILRVSLEEIGPFPVHRLAERVHHPAHHGLADRHLRESARCA